LGLSYYREGNKDKALENYQLALKFKPNFPLVYSNMGIIFFERGELEKAKESYEKAVQYDPRMIDALRNLGAVHAMQKNFPEAIKWFSQALQYAPDDPTINFYLGSAYRDAGRVAEGQPYLEKAYRLDPKLKK
jgi:tetratricopeptide (TPR) repeat protein